MSVLPVWSLPGRGGAKGREKEIVPKLKNVEEKRASVLSVRTSVLASRRRKGCPRPRPKTQDPNRTRFAKIERCSVKNDAPAMTGRKRLFSGGTHALQGKTRARKPRFPREKRTSAYPPTKRTLKSCGETIYDVMEKLDQNAKNTGKQALSRSTEKLYPDADRRPRGDAADEE